MRFFDLSCERSLFKNRSLTLKLRSIFLRILLLRRLIMFTVVALSRKFYYIQQRPQFVMMEGDNIYHSNDSNRLSINYIHARGYYITRIHIHTHIHTRTVIPSRNDMASTKMRVSCSHWYCFAHLRKKDRSKALHIHTRSSLRFFFSFCR